MADTKIISKVAVGSDQYELRDLDAQSRIEALESYTDYLGVTTTELTDGASTNPITIGGESVTAKKGNIANYGAKEFIYNGTIWQEFGDLSALGALAYEDSAEVTGTAAAQAFTGTEATITSTLSGGTAEAVVTAVGNATKANIKEVDDEGSVTAGSAASFTQGADSFTQGSDSFTANTPTAVSLPTTKNTSVVTDQGAVTTGSVTIPTTGTATYTPAGTNGISAVSGTAAPAV